MSQSDDNHETFLRGLCIGTVVGAFITALATIALLYFANGGIR